MSFYVPDSVELGHVRHLDYHAGEFGWNTEGLWPGHVPKIYSGAIRYQLAAGHYAVGCDGSLGSHNPGIKPVLPVRLSGFAECLVNSLYEAAEASFCVVVTLLSGDGVGLFL